MGGDAQFYDSFTQKKKSIEILQMVFSGWLWATHFPTIFNFHSNICDKKKKKRKGKEKL